MRRSTPGPISARRLWWTTTALMALALLVHARAMAVPFIYDDVRTVLANPSIRPPLDAWFLLTHEPFRPLTNLSFGLDRWLWGLEPRGFHSTAVLLHMFNVALVHAWLIALGGAPRTAACCTALFAVHPALTQAVGYVSGRADVLCATGVLLAAFAHERWRCSGARVWLVVLVGCWGGALAAKETAAPLPLVLLLLDRLRPNSTTGRSLLLVALLMVMAAGAIGRLAWYLAHEQLDGDGSAAVEHARILPGALLRYLCLALAPAGQAIVHGRPSSSLPHIIGATLLLTGLVALTWIVTRPAPLARAGGVWFLGFLGPSLAVPLTEPVAEQRLYLPTLGALLSVSSLLHQRSKAVRTVVITALVVGACAAFTAVRYRLWSDPYALWTEALTRDPTLPVAWTNRGVVAYESGDRIGARADFERALALDPRLPVALTNRATMRADDGDLEGALQDIRSALAAWPNFVHARVVGSRVLGLLGDFSGAVTEASAALALDPTNVHALTNRAAALRALGRHEESIRDYDAALRLAPHFAPARRGRRTAGRRGARDPVPTEQASPTHSHGDGEPERP